MEISEKELNRLEDQSFWQGAAVGVFFVGILWSVSSIWQTLGGG